MEVGTAGRRGDYGRNLMSESSPRDKAYLVARKKKQQLQERVLSLKMQRLEVQINSGCAMRRIPVNAGQNLNLESLSNGGDITSIRSMVPQQVESPKSTKILGRVTPDAFALDVQSRFVDLNKPHSNLNFLISPPGNRLKGKDLSRNLKDKALSPNIKSEIGHLLFESAPIVDANDNLMFDPRMNVRKQFGNPRI